MGKFLRKTMNPIHACTHWPKHIRVLLWLLLLAPFFLSGCKSQPTHLTEVRTAATNTVVITSKNWAPSINSVVVTPASLTLGAKSNSLEIVNTNPLTLQITNPVGVRITNPIVLQVTNTILLPPNKRLFLAWPTNSSAGLVVSNFLSMGTGQIHVSAIFSGTNSYKFFGKPEDHSIGVAWIQLFDHNFTAIVSLFTGILSFFFGKLIRREGDKCKKRLIVWALYAASALALLLSAITGWGFAYHQWNDRQRGKEEYKQLSNQLAAQGKEMEEIHRTVEKQSELISTLLTTNCLTGRAKPRNGPDTAWAVVLDEQLKLHQLELDALNRLTGTNGLRLSPVNVNIAIAESARISDAILVLIPAISAMVLFFNYKRKAAQKFLTSETNNDGISIESLKDRWWLVVLGIAGLLAIHLLWPHAAVDSITLILIVVMFLPWLAPLFESISLGGLTLKSSKKLKHASINVREKFSDLPRSPSDSEVAKVENRGVSGLNDIRLEIQKQLDKIAKLKDVQTQGSDVSKLLGLPTRREAIKEKQRSALEEFIDSIGKVAAGGAVFPDAARLAISTGLRLKGWLAKKVVVQKKDLEEPTSTLNELNMLGDPSLFQDEDHKLLKQLHKEKTPVFRELRKRFRTAVANIVIASLTNHQKYALGDYYKLLDLAARGAVIDEGAAKDLIHLGLRLLAWIKQEFPAKPSSEKP